MNPSTESFMKECRVCPRNCNVDRLSDQRDFAGQGRDHPCQGSTSYVGGTLYFRKRRLRCGLFFRLFTGL